MNILFLSYWGINEGLTAATVFPHLEILAGFPHIKKILLITIERDRNMNLDVLPQHEKIFHQPLISKRPLPNIINKIYDFVDFPQKLKQICIKENIHTMIARGAPPGALAMKVSKKTGIPFYVESFEPHADYMYESGTWKWYDPRYIFQKKWEKQQFQRATALMPVAENYRNLLIAQGVNKRKMDVIPCCVPLEVFRFNKNERATIRKQLSIRDNIAGIYTGKFGGIYYREEAFIIFKKSFDHFENNFFLLILSPDDKNWIDQMLSRYNIPKEKVFTASVPHKEVPSYLSAADFAFSLQSPKRSNLYLSPIKNAEYWAAGLPVLMTAGVGDDAQIIEQANAGAIIRGVEDEAGIIEGLNTIKDLTKEENIKNRLYDLAHKHRNFNRVLEIYRKWYGK